MSTFTENYIAQFMKELAARNPGETEFHQAVKEVLESVEIGRASCRERV